MALRRSDSVGSASRDHTTRNIAERSALTSASSQLLEEQRGRSTISVPPPLPRMVAVGSTSAKQNLGRLTSSTSAGPIASSVASNSAAALSRATSLSRVGSASMARKPSKGGVSGVTSLPQPASRKGSKRTRISDNLARLDESLNTDSSKLPTLAHQDCAFEKANVEATISEDLAIKCEARNDIRVGIPVGIDDETSSRPDKLLSSSRHSESTATCEHASAPLVEGSSPSHVEKHAIAANASSDKHMMSAAKSAGLAKFGRAISCAHESSSLETPIQSWSRSVSEPGRYGDEQSKEKLLSEPEVDTKHWTKVRRQTRTTLLEEAISRRGSKGHWELAAGEGLDWEHIRNQRYECKVPFNAMLTHHLVGADDCINALVERSRKTRGWHGVRVLDLGCGVGSFILRLRLDSLEIDWSATFGVTSVHDFDMNVIDSPPESPDFLDKHILKFDLDTLADCSDTHLFGYQFDLVTSHYCFCHLKDPLGALCVAFELLRPGGTLLFIEPFRELTTALPYTDQLNYHLVNTDGQLDAVSLHKDLLPSWVEAGVAVFSSCQTSSPFRHVLALRRLRPDARLVLPKNLKCGGSEVSKWPPALIRQARSGDLKQPFMSPTASSFKEWLCATL